MAAFLLPFLCFSVLSAQSQKIDPLKFGYNFSQFANPNDERLYSFFYNDNGDTVLVASDSLQVLYEIPSRGWSFSMDPVVLNDGVVSFPQDRSGISILKWDNEQNKIDSTFVGIKGNEASVVEDDLIVVREYPYVVAPGRALDSVAVYKVNWNGDIGWKASILRPYGNISGSLWTNNTCICNDFVAVLHPLTDEVRLINTTDGALGVSLAFSLGKQSWSNKMDSAYSSWGGEVKPGLIKKYLGEISKWQKMSLRHLEQVFCDGDLLGVVETFNMQSIVHYYSKDGDFIDSVFLDEKETLPFLGKEVKVAKGGEFLAITIQEQKDSLYYSIEKRKSPIHKIKREVIISDLMFCESCITKEFNGIIVFESSSSINIKIEKAKFGRKYPKALVFGIKDLELFRSYAKNQVISLQGLELVNFIEKLK